MKIHPIKPPNREEQRSHLKAGAQQEPHFPWENQTISPLCMHRQPWQHQRSADQRTEAPLPGIQPRAQAPCPEDGSRQENRRQTPPPSANPMSRSDKAQINITNLTNPSRLANEKKDGAKITI